MMLGPEHRVEPHSVHARNSPGIRRCTALPRSFGASGTAGIVVGSPCTRIAAEVDHRGRATGRGLVTISSLATSAVCPYTLTTVAVQESLWGTQQASLTVATPGGAQANSKFRVGTVMAGLPVMLQGQRAVFLLAPDRAHGGYAIVGFGQGMLPLLKTSQGDAVMLPGAEQATELAAASRRIRDLRTRGGDQLAR